MSLTNYRECSPGEKRAVLRVFWSRRAHDSEKITRAAHEYSSYALALVAIIAAEVVVIAVALVARADRWAWAATTAAVLAAWSLGWTLICRRHITRAATD